MSLRRKGGVESKWPREGVVTARISIDEWHGGMSEMKCTSVNPVFYCPTRSRVDSV